MREHFEKGDELCFHTSDSPSLHIDAQRNGSFAKLYSSLKNIVYPQERTVVRNKSRNDGVIALLQEGDLFPFHKEFYHFDDICKRAE